MSSEVEELPELWRGAKLSPGTEGAITDSDVLSEGRFAVSSAASAWGERACKPEEEGAELLAAGAFQSQPAKLSLLLLREKCYSQAGFLTSLIAGLIAQICSTRRYISSPLQSSYSL